MATCFSPLSRNFQVGFQLAQGASINEIIAKMKQVAEGVYTTHSIHHYAQTHDVYMPITEGVYRVVHEGTSPLEVLGQLMEIKRFTHEDASGWD
jgi:glycerol-3-phosphate dehydrogenase (NAD(P)+)